MLTVDALREYGADVDTGLARCMNNEAYYLRFVNMVIGDDKLGALKEALDARDFERAFDLAHAMKGACGNLSLTPIYRPVSEISDGLKKGKDMDYTALCDEAVTQFEKLKKLAE